MDKQQVKTLCKAEIAIKEVRAALLAYLGLRWWQCLRFTRCRKRVLAALGAADRLSWDDRLAEADRKALQDAVDDGIRSLWAS